MSRHTTARFGMTAGLILAVLASALMLSAARTPVLAGGSETGTCTFEISAADKIFGDSAVVVPQEATHFYGEFWQPGVNATLVRQRVGSSSTTNQTVPIPASGPTQGKFQAGWFPPNSAVGNWQFTGRQSSPACVQVVTLKVLPLTDILNSKFLGDIKWLYTEGITFGCTATTFCPNGLVTRGQMATFISRALDLPPTNVDYFTDDNGTTHEANINRLRHADITFGCGGTRFCPNGIVTRGQMASFLVRAFDLPSTPNNYFTDDNGTTHEANINRLRAANITSGCGGTNFCPNGQVTRGQMAAFLHRAIE